MASVLEGLRHKNSQSSMALVDTVDTRQITHFWRSIPLLFLTQGLILHPKSLASPQGEPCRGHKAVCPLCLASQRSSSFWNRHLYSLCQHGLHCLSELLSIDQDDTLCVEATDDHLIPSKSFLGLLIAGAFFTKLVDLGSSSLKLEIWDTAGQEKYHSVCHLYFRGANAALLVYDITRKVGSLSTSFSRQLCAYCLL